jgi:hypothetical protein
VICGPTSLAWPWRRRVYEIIEIGQGDDRASRLLGTGIVALILTNIAAFVAETVPELAGRYGLWFHAFEAFSVLIFTIDYAALGPRWRCHFWRGRRFGIGAMLEGEPSRRRFVTTSRCRLLKLFREDFHRLETANPAIAGVGRAGGREQARAKPHDAGRSPCPPRAGVARRGGRPH